MEALPYVSIFSDMITESRKYGHPQPSLKTDLEYFLEPNHIKNLNICQVVDTNYCLVPQYDYNGNVTYDDIGGSMNRFLLSGDRVKDLFLREGLLNSMNLPIYTRVSKFRLELPSEYLLGDEDSFKKWFPYGETEDEAMAAANDWRTSEMKRSKYHVFFNVPNPANKSDFKEPNGKITRTLIKETWGEFVKCFDCSNDLNSIDKLYGAKPELAFSKRIEYYPAVAAASLEELARRSPEAYRAINKDTVYGFDECPWIVAMSQIFGLNIEMEMRLHELFVFNGATRKEIITIWSLLNGYAFGLREEGNNYIGKGVIYINIIGKNMEDVMDQIKGLVNDEKIKDNTIVGVLIDEHITLLYISKDGLGFIEFQTLNITVITYGKSWGTYYKRFVGGGNRPGEEVVALLLCIEDCENVIKQYLDNGIDEELIGGHQSGGAKESDKGTFINTFDNIIEPYLEDKGLTNRNIYKLLRYIRDNDDTCVHIDGNYNPIEILGLFFNTINGYSGETPGKPDGDSHAFDIEFTKTDGTYRETSLYELYVWRMIEVPGEMIKGLTFFGELGTNPLYQYIKGFFESSPPTQHELAKEKFNDIKRRSGISGTELMKGISKDVKKFAEDDLRFDLWIQTRLTGLSLIKVKPKEVDLSSIEYKQKTNDEQIRLLKEVINKRKDIRDRLNRKRLNRGETMLPQSKRRVVDQGNKRYKKSKRKKSKRKKSKRKKSKRKKKLKTKKKY